MEINHFSHEHPLVLSEEKRSSLFRCDVCGQHLFGLSYCCQTCLYTLHKWCAELPSELSLTSDHDHILILSRIESEVLCKECDCPIKPSTFAYANKEYPSTKFHVECASFPDDVIERNDHRRGIWDEEENECCSLCQIKDDVPLLHTGVDRYYRHIQCAMLPFTVKHSVHLHSLTLHPPLVENDWYFEFFCDACEKHRDPAFPIYYCEPCKFVAHIGCGVFGSDMPLIQDFLGTHPANETKLSETQESTDTEEGDDVYGEEEKIEHFSHEHPLALKSFTRQSKRWKKGCSGCTQSIFGMTYACIEKSCDRTYFYVHKWCAQLPKVIFCSMHPHHGPLKLMESQFLERINQDQLLVEDCVSSCGFCGMDTELISYGCENCDFLVHGICALLPDNLKHQSHEHTLTVVINTRIKSEAYRTQLEYKLPFGSSEYPICQACGFVCEDVSLECKSCDFHLHVHCFLLPYTGKHTTHKHDLNLIYSFKEDPIALEFICDTCEKPRTPNRWVYCCPEPNCYVVSHVDCVVPKYFNTFKHQT